jgi:hypothetical protein
MSVRSSARPSVRQHGTTRLPCTDFDEMWYVSPLFFFFFFESLLKTFRFYENPARITGTLHKVVFVFMVVSRRILLRMRNVIDRVVEKLKIHILYLVTFFRKSCHL